MRGFVDSMLQDLSSSYRAREEQLTSAAYAYKKRHTGTMAESRLCDEFKLNIKDFVLVEDGKDVILPCHLSPEISAVPMTIRWFRKTECIYQYKNGEAGGYGDRVSLITQELKRGNVSLRLRDYRRSDIAVYICQVIHGEQKEEAAVCLCPEGDKDPSSLKQMSECAAELLKCVEYQLKRQESALLLELKLYQQVEEMYRPLGVKNTMEEKDQQLEEMDTALRESEKRLKEKDSILEERNQQLKDTESSLEKTAKQLNDNVTHLQHKVTQLADITQQVRENEILLEALRDDLEVKNSQAENFRVQLQEKDSELEERNQRLGEKDRRLEERDKLLEEKDKQLKEKHRQLEDVKAVGREASDTDPTPPMRRRDSMDLLPPKMGGESSGPDSPVSPSVSDLRLVLLGRTGAGRSAVGNTILGREEFGAQASPSAVTQRSERREGDVCGRRLVLVDTPDWFSPGLSLEEMRRDVGLCVSLSYPGPHAFLLVLPVEPSKGEERGVLERMEKMFGEGCWGHTVILFTHADSLKEHSIEEFLQAWSQDLQQLVEKCGNRYHVLNIKDRAHGTQVPELLDQVEEMMAGNRESFYSSQTYQETEAQAREIEGEIQREIEEKKQKEEREMKERIEKELQESLKKIEGVIQEHEGDIRTLNDRTTELEKQVKEERDEEKKRALEMELKRESDRREDMERKLKKFREKKEKERVEMDERHRQEMEEIRENYEGQARVEAERNLMKVVLPEIQRNIMISKTKMQREFSRMMEEKDRQMERQMEEKDRQMERQMEEKDRQMERLRQTFKELNDAHSKLEKRLVREGRVQRVLIGGLHWVRRNSSSWVLHNLT